MKILFYDTKSYDKESFEAKAKDYPDIQIEYLKSGKRIRCDLCICQQ